MVPQTIVELFLQAVTAHNKPDALLVRREGSYHSISSSELLEKVKQLAAALVDLGIAKGDRVALLSENRPEWTISDMAILSVGAVNVPFYPSLPATQVESQILDAGAKVILVSNKIQHDKIIDFKDRVPGLEKVILFEGPAPVSSKCLLFEDLLKVGGKVLEKSPSLFEQRCERVRAQDLASILYTAGTTGIPKGVMLSHSNIVSNVLGCSEVLHLDESDVALSFLPLCHIFERTACYLQIYRGVTIAYAESPDTVPQNLIEVRPTVVASVPRLFEKLHARIMETIETSSPLKRSLMRWALSIGREHSRLVLSKARVSIGLGLQQRLASSLVFSKAKRKARRPSTDVYFGWGSARPGPGGVFLRRGYPHP